MLPRSCLVPDCTPINAVIADDAPAVERFVRYYARERVFQRNRHQFDALRCLLSCLAPSEQCLGNLDTRCTPRTPALAATPAW